VSALLEISGLSIAFGGRAVVEDVALSLPRGRTLGLVGESGSGKSLTALAVMGLLPEAARLDPRARIVFDGSDIAGLPERAMRGVRGRRIGIVFQDPMACLNPFMPVGRQIAEAARAHLGLSAEAARARARALLEEVGLPEPDRRLGAYPHELSGGQQQRVMLASALAADPDLLIADEATTALDATIQHEILKLLRGLQARREMAMLFISHDLGVVAAMADETAVMRNGRIVESGPTRDVLMRPRESYTRALIDARRRLSAAPGPSSAAGAPVVGARNLRIAYRRRLGLGPPCVAVEAASFGLERGRTLGLVGESGSGKSSIARALVSLVRPVSGELRILGQSLSETGWRAPRSLRGRRQIVFQNPLGALNPRMTVERLLLEPLDSAAGAGAARRRLVALLEEVGLCERHLARYPHELSGGQRQRVCIARALLSDPELLICDEVVSSLDVTTQAQVVALLARLQAERGFAMLFIAHDLEVVGALAHDVAVMRGGRIVEHGPARAVLTVPQDAYAASLVAAMRAVALTAEHAESVA
jgi:peptide/nickel transport system ATP-binding protein